jgi:hypothetical protein
MLKYFEELIVRGTEKQEELNEQMKVFSVLFKFLKERDCFEKWFRRGRALRMIYGTNSAATALESGIIDQMLK